MRRILNTLPPALLLVLWIGAAAAQEPIRFARTPDISPDGKRLAYVRGPGDWYRMGYRGSSNDDIWLCNADGSDNRRLTAFEGQDHSPMWSPDGRTLYYVTEYYGTANIVAQPLSPDTGA